MHISLDSAIGQQRRLNQVGETINSIAAPAAAYSLRSLTGGDPLVVRVRRGSDDSEKDFTVSGINSGALVDFVGSGFISNGVFSNSGYESFSNASASGFTAANTGSTGFALSAITSGSSGDVVNVTFDLELVSGSPSLSLRAGSPAGTTESNLVSFSSSGSYTAVLTATGSFDKVGITEGDAPSEFTVSNFKITTKNGFVAKWYDQSGNNRPLIQTNATEQPLIVESGTFLNGVKSNKAVSNDTMQNLQVSSDGTNANFGTDDWASGASSKLGLIYVGSIVTANVVSPSSTSVVWGGGRGVSGYQSGGLSLQVIKSGNDSWRLTNERVGLSPQIMTNAFTLNTDNDMVLYGIADNREFTINVNNSGDTETESADLDTRENAPLSLFGAYSANSERYYQRSTGGVCKECYLYAGTSITSIPAIATKINEHYSIYS